MSVNVCEGGREEGKGGKVSVQPDCPPCIAEGS